MRRLGAVLVFFVAVSALAGGRPDLQTILSVSRSHLNQTILPSMGANTELRAKENILLDTLGQAHVRYQQFYRGVPVFEGELIAHVDTGRASVLSVTNALHKVRGIESVEPIIRNAGARALVLQQLGLREARTDAALTIYVSEKGRAHLAWRVHAVRTSGSEGPIDRITVLDARNGRVLLSYDNLHTATGTGNGFFNGTVTLETTPISGGFSLKDPSRGNQYSTDMNNGTNGNGTLFTDADNTWGNGLLSNRQTIAVDAQYGTAVTWDYYQAVHGRNGIANDGAGAFNRVHYSSGYNNAFWSDSCFCMTYGDGDGVTFNPFDSLDVAGHEMSHGVTSRTANLRYSQESGGLNEATSDIFGTAVEFYANNPNDAGDYLIGEKLYKSGNKALRYMYRPSKDGASADCWSNSLKRLDVHYSSGVANHFFYLLSEGSGVSQYTDGTGATTCTGVTLTGIGRNKGEQIWYRALTVYMTSRTAYSGARAATLSAAADLYGAGSAEQNAVAAAWSAVNVN